MKNYTWAKGYKYTNVPTFFKRLDLFGFTFIVQSHKTKRRRTGVMISRPEVWNQYLKLYEKS